ncbi:4Fe-4S dicluster domain-containing protein [Desulfallas sp. Bu1-1]|jgi:heterodisulfide reductase subunit C|uniref:4Fe-4S dicluster domain-containing protein n=1 Tax=Desulfallas sp. Bu1-1 TaxID=2787620 RepID=UPI00189DAFE0|nr:4Fe-4S dicluster domain-containing protein [Desulfallas sp. Bu1-1]MBF7083127.1 4Fe-4S dicluster domain-containing protein [Desulfallas sp. Bu1-1]
MGFINAEKRNFFNEVRERSGQPIELCYQCQKCASGCIATQYADYYPNEIIRMLQFGQIDRVLNCSSIWICSSCETCGARCPNGINVAEVMDALKEMAIARGIIKEKKINLFHNVFLNSVRSHGRVHEGSMMAIYKLKSGDLMSDLDIGWQMFKKGKMPLLPHRIKARGKLKNIFNKTSSNSYHSTVKPGVDPGGKAGDKGLIAYRPQDECKS